MYDILPFPNITASDLKGQVEQINNYLIQFKEELEFILTNLGEDNLADTLVQTIHALSESAGKTTDEETLQQVVQSGLKITDVINSKLFKEETIKNIKVNGILLERDSDRAVNMQVPTDYIVKGEQTTLSEESEGINVYTFTDSSGGISTFEVKNGKDGEKGEKGDTGATGADGAKGDTGANGVSCTHAWNGTTLTVTSASGTSSANLKGEKGDTGETGAKGADGKTPTITFSVNFDTGNLEYTTT